MAEDDHLEMAYEDANGHFEDDTSDADVFEMRALAGDDDVDLDDDDEDDGSYDREADYWSWSGNGA